MRQLGCGISILNQESLFVDMEKPLAISKKFVLGVVLPTAIILLLIAYASIEIYDSQISPGEYLVAVGTIMLVLFTFVATLTNRSEIAADRKIRHIQSQLEELYWPIIIMSEKFMIGSELSKEEIEKIELKAFLGIEEIWLNFMEFSSKMDEYWAAESLSSIGKDNMIIVPPEKKKAYDLEMTELMEKTNEAKEAAMECAGRLNVITYQEYFRIYDELQKLEP